jgi:hypothetical protein
MPIDNPSASSGGDESAQPFSILQAGSPGATASPGTAYSCFGTNQGTGGASFSGVEANRQTLMPVPVTLSRFFVRSNSQQPSDGDLVLTIRVTDGVTGVAADTSIEITIPADAEAGTFSDTAHTAEANAGDLVSIRAENASASASAAISQVAIVASANS